MKKILVMIMMAVFILFPKNVSAFENDTINMFVFYGDGCPHCTELHEYLDTSDLPGNVNIIYYETWYDFFGKTQMGKALKVMNDTSSGVPYVVIGDQTFVGFAKGTTDVEIEKAIEIYSDNFYNDTLGVAFGLSEAKEYPEGYTYGDDYIKNLPILGEVNIKEVSVLLATVVLGIVDGFNPCSMWVLLFLISMLLGMKNRKRMWILGGTFIITSAIIYYLFMTAWLNIMQIVGTPIIMQVLIGIFATVMGGFYLRDWWKSRKEGISCKTVKGNQKNKIIEKIKQFTKEKSLWLALGGIIILAITVNAIELFCSLGLPVIYTEVLTVSGVNNISYYLYILLYVFFFMLDDIIIFSIAMFTLKITGLSNKYSRYAKLIGGIVMAIIGLLMIFAPGILM